MNGLVNIYTGIKVRNSNIYESAKLGEQQRPDGFCNVIKKELRTMKSRKKCSNSGEIEVFNNTELIYFCVMYLLAIRRITLEDVLMYELSLTLLPLFENTGEMRTSKSKSDLKKALQGETSLRLQLKPEILILDGWAKR